MRLIFSLALILVSALSVASDHTYILNSCQTLKQQPSAEQANACRFFIKGFMAASALTDMSLDRQPTTEQSDFFKRAYDNRLGSNNSERRQQVCNSPQNHEAIIHQVSQNLPTDFTALTDVQSVIINAIKHHQSCSENNT